VAQLAAVRTFLTGPYEREREREESELAGGQRLTLIECQQIVSGVSE